MASDLKAPESRAREIHVQDLLLCEAGQPLMLSFGLTHR